MLLGDHTKAVNEEDSGAVAATRRRLGAFGSIPILHNSISMMPRYSGSLALGVNPSEVRL